MRVVVESLGDALFVHDLEGRIVECNRRACESLGYSREEILARNIADVDRQQTRTTLLGRLGRDREAGALTGEGLHVRKDGSTFPVEVRVAVLRKGQEPLFVSTARDVSERQAGRAAAPAQRTPLPRALRGLPGLRVHPRRLRRLARPSTPPRRRRSGIRCTRSWAARCPTSSLPEVREQFPAYLAEVLREGAGERSHEDREALGRAPGLAVPQRPAARGRLGALRHRLRPGRDRADGPGPGQGAHGPDRSPHRPRQPARRGGGDRPRGRPGAPASRRRSASSSSTSTISRPSTTSADTPGATRSCARSPWP